MRILISVEKFFLVSGTVVLNYNQLKCYHIYFQFFGILISLQKDRLTQIRREAAREEFENTNMVSQRGAIVFLLYA